MSQLDGSAPMRPGLVGSGGLAHDAAEDLLPLYAAGSLDAAGAHGVETHLATCAECRADLALWLEVGSAVVDETSAAPKVSPDVLAGALSRVRAERLFAAGAFARAATLVRAQLLVLRHEIWLSSLLVMLLGYVVALLSGQGDRAAVVVGVLAPLVAAAGIASIYGPESDPGLELALATPTSPRQVLLARLVVVFGYDFLLALAATIGLLPLVPLELLGGIALGWLGPMAFLSALALLLSLRFGAETAAAVAFAVWVVRWLARGFASQASSLPDPGSALGSTSRLLDAGFGSPYLLLALGAVLLAAALWLVGREFRPATRPAL